MITRGNGTNLLALHLDGIACTRDGAVEEFDTHNLLLQSHSLLLGECTLTDKLLLVEFHEDAESGLERSDIIAQFMSVERQCHLETQGVAATESARCYLARGDECIPHLIYIGMRTIQLESILTGVARAAGNDRLAINLYLLEGVEGKFAHGEPEQTSHHLLALRPLHSHLTVIVRLIIDDHIIALALLHDPGMVLVNVRCVHHKQILTLAHSIHEQVIHAAAMRVAHDAVVDFAIRRTGNVIRKNMIDKLLCIGATDEDLAHV